MPLHTATRAFPSKNPCLTPSPSPTLTPTFASAAAARGAAITAAAADVPTAQCCHLLPPSRPDQPALPPLPLPLPLPQMIFLLLMPPLPLVLLLLLLLHALMLPLLVLVAPPPPPLIPLLLLPPPLLLLLLQAPACMRPLLMLLQGHGPAPHWCAGSGSAARRAEAERRRPARRMAIAMIRCRQLRGWREGQRCSKLKGSGVRGPHDGEMRCGAVKPLNV